MHFIIFDLEATCWEGRPPTMVQEIIEIGALRVNQFGEVESSFNRFIKPKLHPFLSTFCQQLTSIRQLDVDRASGFVSVIEDFQDWADVYDEDYLLCSWGSFDRKMLIQDCKLHKIEEDWAERHINLKQQYHDFKRLRRPRGLKAAVEAEGYEFAGRQHRGIYDAQNLTRLFIHFLDEWRY